MGFNLDTTTYNLKSNLKPSIKRGPSMYLCKAKMLNLAYYFLKK